jgi:molybdopterin synthase catalytic subunit
MPSSLGWTHCRAPSGRAPASDPTSSNGSASSSGGTIPKITTGVPQRGARHVGYGSTGFVPYDGGVSDHLTDVLWCGLRETDLPVASVESWVRRPSCGAVVTFVGTARDHSDGRPGVVELVYEAYDRYAASCFVRVADEARRRWPTVERVAVLHRTGRVRVGEDAVVVAVAAPHRDEAFPAAAFVIDAVKATAPIWKLERWADGESWSPNCRCADRETLGGFGLVGTAS